MTSTNKAMSTAEELEGPVYWCAFFIYLTTATKNCGFSPAEDIFLNRGIHQLAKLATHATQPWNAPNIPRIRNCEAIFIVSQAG